MVRPLWDARIKDVQEEVNRQLDALAEQFRQTVVIPLCRKHKLHFVSGMGVFSFYYNSTGFSILEDEAPAYLRDVLDVLHTEYGQFEFGHYVNDVREQDTHNF